MKQEKAFNFCNDTHDEKFDYSVTHTRSIISGPELVSFHGPMNALRVSIQFLKQHGSLDLHTTGDL